MTFFHDYELSDLQADGLIRFAAFQLHLANLPDTDGGPGPDDVFEAAMSGLTPDQARVLIQAGAHAWTMIQVTDEEQAATLNHSYTVLEQTADWTRLECHRCGYRTSDVEIDLRATVGSTETRCPRDTDPRATHTPMKKD